MDDRLEKEFAFHEPKKSIPYFEGWYYHVTSKDISFSIIIGIQATQQQTSAFMQMIDTMRKTSTYHTFSSQQVHMKFHPFQIHLGTNVFTKDYLHIAIDGFSCDLRSVGFIHLDKNTFMPTIMGPFSYYKNMECIHSIISLYHNVHGTLKVGNKAYQIQGIGYIEKDRGTSFPSFYTWYQSNTCTETYASFFFSVATIPLKQFSFTGCICVLMINGKQQRFATYLGCRSKRIKENTYALYQYPYTLYIKFKPNHTYSLLAPSQGEMNVKIHESLDSFALVHLYKHHKRIQAILFTHGGYEQR